MKTAFAETCLEPEAHTSGEDKAISEFADAEARLREVVVHGGDLDAALTDCLAAAPPEKNASTIYYRIGEIALQAERWEATEQLAMRALRHRPDYGAAFKLLGCALSGAGFPEEAALCHRYGLPPRVRDKHFGDAPCVWVDSQSAFDEGVEVRTGHSEARWPLRAPLQMRPREIAELTSDELCAKAGVTARVPGGKLWFDGFNAVVWDRAGRIVRDLCHGYAEVVQGSLGAHEPLRLEGCACLLGNRNAANYYHWLNDVLPRLEVLRASGHALEDVDHFVVNRLIHPFQFETLAALGIGEERLHTIDRGTYVDADELLVPTYGSNSLGMRQGPWNPAFLVRALAPPPDLEPATRRLYISRGSEGARGIVNEAELLACLERHGFETARTERMTVREQAALFARAEAVVGPHGAGFSNIVFCRPGTHVVELFDSHILPCFWAISELTGLRHTVHFCGDADASVGAHDSESYHRTAAERRHAPFRVEVSEIEALLEFLGLAHAR